MEILNTKGAFKGCSVDIYRFSVLVYIEDLKEVLCTSLFLEDLSEIFLRFFQAAHYRQRNYKYYFMEVWGILKRTYKNLFMQRILFKDFQAILYIFWTFRGSSIHKGHSKDAQKIDRFSVPLYIEDLKEVLYIYL